MAGGARIVLTTSGLVENRVDILTRLRHTDLEWITIDTLPEVPSGETRSVALTRVAACKG